MSQRKCQYCEEYKPVQDIENKLNVTFFTDTDTFQSRYLICDECLNLLKKYGSLTSKDGKCTIKLD